MKILIIEDQEGLAKMLKKGLEVEGFAADYVLDGEAGSRRIGSCHRDYDLVILDIGLPRKSGREICREMREKKIATPVIMLTAQDGSENIISGLNLGADDYLVKPFSFDILLARIRALLRRPKATLGQKLQIGNIVIDSLKRKVFCQENEVRLTMKEFGLLEYLMRNPSIVLNREQILSNVWDYAYDSLANVVDVHITSIRKKLGDKDGKIIETVRGIGYKINAEK